MSYNGLNLIERFWINVKKTELCWEWIGGKNGAGYGTICVGGKATPAHRVSFVLHYGQIKKNNVICHRCDNPSCVRPDHLFQGSYSDNSKDAYAKGRLSITDASKASRFKKGNKPVNNKAVTSDERIKMYNYYKEVQNIAAVERKFNRSKSCVYVNLRMIEKQ